MTRENYHIIGEINHVLDKMLTYHMIPVPCSWDIYNVHIYCYHVLEAIYHVHGHCYHILRDLPYDWGHLPCHWELLLCLIIHVPCPDIHLLCPRICLPFMRTFTMSSETFKMAWVTYLSCPGDCSIPGSLGLKLGTHVRKWFSKLDPFEL
jgi:hypothetical protein